MAGKQPPKDEKRLPWWQRPIVIPCPPWLQPMAWLWRNLNIDIFRGCKTGEFIEPVPKPSLREIAPKLALGITLIPLAIWGKSWILRYSNELGDELKVLQEADPALAAYKTAVFLTWLYLSSLAVAIALVISFLIGMARVVRAGRYPLPGVKVFRRTAVVAGWWCVRLPSLFLGVFFLAMLIVSWRLSVEAISEVWNGYIDRKAEAVLKIHHRPQIPAELLPRKPQPPPPGG